MSAWILFGQGISLLSMPGLSRILRLFIIIRYRHSYTKKGFYGILLLK